MCYSAIVWQAFEEYARLMAVQPDYELFEQLYQQRLTEKAIRIPRGLDRNFDAPKTAAEKRIRELIEVYRSGAVTRLEQELFGLRKRLADAERKLKEKETKTALNEQRIAKSKIDANLERLALLKGTQSHPDDNRIFPMTFAPIVVKEGDERILRPARYHLRQKDKAPSVDRQFPGLYNARRDNLEKFWRNEFGHDHALMVVDSFFENVERDGKNVVLHFMPRPAQVMLVASLCATWTGSDGQTLLSFAAITDEPPAEVKAAGHDRCIINIKDENVDRWLSPIGRSSAELQRILDERQQPYYERQVEAA